MPRLSKASAAVSPPMPAPTTTTFFDVLMGDFPAGVTRVVWPADESLLSHAGSFHHRGPARDFRRDKSRKILRRGNSRFEAELFHAGDHLGGLQRLIDRGVEPFHDVGGNSGRRPHPGPELKRELVETELLHGGH